MYTEANPLVDAIPEIARLFFGRVRVIKVPGACGSLVFFTATGISAMNAGCSASSWKTENPA